MRTLRMLFRKFWDVLPSKPLLYACTNNGVTGLVRADDFDDEVRRMRSIFKQKGWPSVLGDLGAGFEPVRPQVYPVFLFSNKIPEPRNVKVGTFDDMRDLVKCCCVEERSFDLPPIYTPGLARRDYFGVWEEVGHKDSRHRKWSFNEAWKYLVHL